MAGLTRIFTLFCVAGCRPSPASPVLRSAHVVQAGQNTTLSCNLTESSDEITWYRLRSDQLLPLLTVRRMKITGHTTDAHTADARRFSVEGDLESGSVGLEILEVEEEDAGLYFCSGRRAQTACVSRGVHLTVTGADGDPAGDQTKQPCWNLGICALPGLLALCFVLVAGSYLCTGKPAVCCRDSVGRDYAPREAEDVTLHYSIVKLAGKPGHSARGCREDVTYSAVTGRRSPDESRGE